MSVTDDDEDPEFLAMLAESVKAEKDREQEDKGTLNLVKKYSELLESTFDRPQRKRHRRRELPPLVALDSKEYSTLIETATALCGVKHDFGTGIVMSLGSDGVSDDDGWSVVRDGDGGKAKTAAKSPDQHDGRRDAPRSAGTGQGDSSRGFGGASV